MSVVTFGFGESAARVVTLGFGAATQSGSYVTLGYGEAATRTAMLGLTPGAGVGTGGSYITFGYGESASKAAMLGLVPGAATPGSYITLGQGQSASLFLRLGLYIGDEGSPVEPPPTPEIVTVSGSGYQFFFPRVDHGERIKREDDEIIALIMSMIQTGIIH